MRDELDELLDRYAPEAGELWLSTLPEQAPVHEFSPKFRRKVEKLLRRQRRSPAVNAALRYARRAAAFVLVFLTLSFSCLMAADAAFRERVIRAVMEVFQDFTEFTYTSDSPALEEPGNLVFTYLPKGMEEIEAYREDDEIHAYFYFDRDNGDFFTLEQIKVDENTNSQRFFDTEDANVTMVQIRNSEAIGTEKGSNCTLHWTEGNFVYTLSGTIPLDELIMVAKGIQIGG